MFYHIACGNAMTDEKKGGRRKEEGGRRREELSGGGHGRFGRDGGLKKTAGPALPRALHVSDSDRLRRGVAYCTTALMKLPAA
jgi:hypothetical protein